MLTINEASAKAVELEQAVERIPRVAAAAYWQLLSHTGLTFHLFTELAPALSSATYFFCSTYRPIV